jgi:hypothetical protein
VARKAKTNDKLPDSDIESLKTEFQSIFKDSEMWPGRMPRWYYGHVPRLATPLPEKERWGVLKEIHFQLVRLAGFIWSMRATDLFQSRVKAVQEHDRIIEELARGRTAN